MVQPDLDTQVLSDFIYELNISRRHLATYPPEHPIIDSSIAKVLSQLELLIEFRETITLGIAKDSLLFDQEWLDKNNPVYRDFATALARLDIATISFHRQMRRDELLQFNQLLRSDRQTIVENGGFSALLPKFQITNIEIVPIDYSSFHTIDEDRLEGENPTGPLWEDFLTGLLADKLSQDGKRGRTGKPLDPKIVAEILNQKYHQQTDGSAREYDQVISTFISKLQQSDRQQDQSHGQFAELINGLSPDLRRQFLNSAFRSFDPAHTTTEEVLSKLPAEVIVETLEEFNQNRTKISSAMVNLLGKLSKHRQKQVESLTSGTTTGSQELKEQLIGIFREEEQGKFTPKSYQQALTQIITVDGSLALPASDIESLQRQIQQDSGERHSCAILLKLLSPQLDPEYAEALQLNLIDLARFFLEVGDFRGLRYLHCGVLNYRQRCPQSPAEQTDRLLETLADPQFQQEVLDNLKRWGEEKQKDIRRYIQTTGEAFANSLVHRLANEEDKSLRRLYLNTLVGMGKAAHQAIYTSLTDDRWYIVRNLLTVLRLQNDPINLETIYPLEDHQHLRVNQELLKLLFKYDRSRADNLLGKQLSSNDPELQAHAIQLAQKSRAPEVIDKLVGILEQDKPTESNLALKTSIVTTLGQVGLENAIAPLERLLFSKSFFKSARLEHLQESILQSLDNYPYEKVKPMLLKLASARQGELSRLAAEKLRQLARNSS